MIRTILKFINLSNPIWVILALALFSRLILSPFGTLSLDFNTFRAWSSILANGNFSNFYNGWSDYLPGYLYILWLLGKYKGSLGIPDEILFKLPAIISDVATGALIYAIVVRLKSQKAGLITASLYLFNPAIYANSTLWGQVDSITAFFSLLSLFLFEINPIGSAIALALGTMLKPQAALTAVVIATLFIKEKWSIGKILGYILISGTVFALGFLPFASGKNLYLFIVERLGVTLNQYPYTSVNAFNFWGLSGFWQPDPEGLLTTKTVGYILTFAFSILVILKTWKEKYFRYFLLATLLSANFLFFTRMHERHLLPALAPLAVLISANPFVAIAYLGFSGGYIANLYYAYIWITENFRSPFSEELIKLFTLINLSSFIFLIYLIYSKLNIVLGNVKLSLTFEPRKKLALPPIPFVEKNAGALVLGILIFSLVSRILFLDYPPKEYFDEVYHAFTAREMLHGNKAAWEWWNTPPAGFAYEWTHPPLAKEGMWLSMAILGESAFSWRFMQAILGTGLVFLIYLAAKHLFEDETTAVFSAFVFSLDGLSLVLSRIGMNDTYMLFFGMLSLYLYLKDKRLFSAVAYGLALGSKWSALWLIPIFGIAQLLFRKKWSASLIWFFILPPLVYLATYIPMFTSGHSSDIFVGMQQQMWWYHTKLRATHPYTSAWWSWPLLLRPIYLYTSSEVEGMVARIYAMGNPGVFWFGFISIIVSLYLGIKERSKGILFVVFSYVMFFVPWALSPRIMFIYHYLPSIPFLAMATGYVLRRNIKYALVCFVAFVLLYLYFYPHWIGMRIPIWLDKSYYWFSSWR